MPQVEARSDEHAEAARQSSDVLGQPDWHQISKLTSLEVQSLLHKYASLRSIRGSTGDIETGTQLPLCKALLVMLLCRRQAEAQAGRQACRLSAA